jgi:MFS family permease
MATQSLLSDSALPVRWGQPVRINVSVGLFALAKGLSYPLFTVILQKQGISATLLGANAAMTPLGSIIAAFMVPRFAERFGVERVLVTSPVVAMLTFAYMAAWQDVWAWFPARFVIGLATGSFYIVTRACSNEKADARHRGRTVALYGTVLSAGFALGPFGLALTGSEGWVPFMVGMAVLLASAAVLLRGGVKMPSLAAGINGSFLYFIPRAPVLLIAAVAFGFVDRATQALLPLYGLHYGVAERVMAAGLGVLNAGNILLQFPIGWLADRTPRRYVLIGCALGTAVGCVALPDLMGTPLLWFVLCVWGALAYGIVTVSHAETGAHFSGNLLFAGTAALSVTYSLGAIVGPPIVGGAMDVFGPDGFPLSLALCSGLLVVLAWFCPLVNVPGKPNDAEVSERRTPGEAGEPTAPTYKERLA